VIVSLGLAVVMSEATTQSMGLRSRDGLLRFARNDDDLKTENLEPAVLVLGLEDAIHLCDQVLEMERLR
jgi:hypothetical protein